MATNDQQCRKRVYGGTYTGHQCTRKAVKDGYCKQHHPDTVKAKQDERDAKWKKERAERRTKAAHETAIRAFCAGFSTEALSKTSLAEVMATLRDCTEHMEWSTAQGEAAYVAAYNISQAMKEEK